MRLMQQLMLPLKLKMPPAKPPPKLKKLQVMPPLKPRILQVKLRMRRRRKPPPRWKSSLNKSPSLISAPSDTSKTG